MAELGRQGGQKNRRKRLDESGIPDRPLKSMGEVGELLEETINRVRQFGPDTDLRRYGLRLCERGGKNAKKRAAVAVARKLAVLLHRLWVTGEVYEPLRHALSAPIAAAA
jgi:hypothetical protein